MNRLSLDLQLILIGLLVCSINTQVSKISKGLLNELAQANMNNVTNFFPTQEIQGFEFSAVGNRAPSRTPQSSLPDTSPSFFLSEFSFPLEESFQISKGALISERITNNLVNRLSLSKEDVMNELPNIDVKGTDIETSCSSPDADSIRCDSSKYRSIIGACNNRISTSWGKSLTKFKRYLPADYADGISQPRVAMDGSTLPSPRLVSIRLHNDIDLPHSDVTHLLMQWGQFLDHDITQTAGTLANNRQTPQCCNVPEGTQHPSCFPIMLPSSDPFYAHFKQRCMEFVRSLPAPREGCTLGSREQLNQLTSFIDASNVYGSTESLASGLRDFTGGKLRSLSSDNGKDLLPNGDASPQQCRRNNPPRGCPFRAGDSRSNLLPTLSILHTLWLREHNRIADKLQQLNPHWNDEIIYLETRRIIGAMMQHIVYNEFLPIVLGSSINRYDLTLRGNQYFEGYNPQVEPSIANSFAAAAFRFGHSTIQPILEKYNKRNQKLNEPDVFLKDVFFNSAELYQPGALDNFLRGLLNEKIQNVDEFMTNQVTNHLFQGSQNRFGLDLASINIQRGRDHGIPSYNAWRNFCNLKPARNFEELENYMFPGSAERFANIYSNVWDIDLFSAGLHEQPVEDGLVGPTFACIIGKQFEDLRIGDRFWYENSMKINSGAFTSKQLQEIRKVKLAKLICDNSDGITAVQEKAMRAENRVNPKKPCSDFHSMNLELWKEKRRRG